MVGHHIGFWESLYNLRRKQYDLSNLNDIHKITLKHHLNQIKNQYLSEEEFKYHGALGDI